VPTTAPPAVGGKQQQRYIAAAAALSASARNNKTNNTKCRTLVTSTPHGSLISEDESTIKLRLMIDTYLQHKNEPQQQIAQAKVYLSTRILEGIMLAQLPATNLSRILGTGNNWQSRNKGGMSGTTQQHQFSSIRESLSRKWGLLRRQLLGRRIGNSARAPISSDNAMPIGFVGVPQLLIQLLRVTQVVTAYNKAKLTAHMKRGLVYKIFYDPSETSEPAAFRRGGDRQQQPKGVSVRSLLRFTVHLCDGDRVYKRVTNATQPGVRPQMAATVVDATVHLRDLDPSDIIHQRQGVRCSVRECTIYPDLPVGSVVEMSPLAGSLTLGHCPHPLGHCPHSRYKREVAPLSIYSRNGARRRYTDNDIYEHCSRA
jgi:hypothetical protein